MGEFAADDETSHKEEKPSKEDESSFKVEKVAKKPSPEARTARSAIKDVEIIEGILIPKYKVSLPKFSLRRKGNSSMRYVKNSLKLPYPRGRTSGSMNPTFMGGG